MNEAPRAPGLPSRGREIAQAGASGEPPCYAALDLGTNNCRLLIATPSAGGFRVVEAYSRIVRLGEGLSQSGRLSEAAMDRALAALRVSGEKVRRRRVVKFRAIATQACRMADNGQAFVNRVANETGVKLQIISPQEEAKLSVAGCLNLLDRRFDAALVVDVGGGSTELSWVDLAAPPQNGAPPLKARNSSTCAGAVPPSTTRTLMRPAATSAVGASTWSSQYAAPGSSVTTTGRITPP